MRWTTDWWGITITAESNEDEELLKSLQAKLPRKLHNYDAYDACHHEGVMADSNDKNFIEEAGGTMGTSSPNEFQLIFHR